ncbi:MAG: DNA primase [Nitrospirota bacterium]
MKANRLLEEIKSKTDIVDIISDYVQLKKAGQNYKGLCPFHSEKTPSFMVSPSKQIFHCFGCGTGGDAISFIIKHENISFGEAIKLLSKKAGIKLPGFRLDKEASKKRETIIQVMKESLNFFRENLTESKSAQEYLNKRGIDKTTIESFHVGYAPMEWDVLFKYLKGRGYSNSVIKDAGLVTFDERGYRDVFRGRVIFPIFNLQNNVIAFGGRVMDDSQPKYLNSPETEVFKKGETLFALNLAKEEIRKKDYAIIVEGYLDAMICHKYGFKNAVAPLGTALTPGHLQKLRRLTYKAVLVFDGDEAGVSAARRSLSILYENDFRAKVLLLPEGEDPDSFLRKNDSHSFRTMLHKAKSLIDFLFSVSKGDRINTIREALGIIASIKDLIIADELLCELSDRSRINESALRGELKKIKTKVPMHRDIEGLRLSRTAMNREEYLLLSAIINFPEKADDVLSRLNIEDLRDETIKSLFKKIRALANKLNIRSLLDKTDNAERALITELSLKPGFDLEHVDRNIEDCFKKLIQKNLYERIRLAEESGDLNLLNSLLLEKKRLIKVVPA